MSPEIIRARDIDHAIEIAETLKNSKRYDYFRGQKNSLWKIVPSWHRLADAEKPLALNKFRQFYYWMKNSEDILPYIDSDDQILAIAQHYGLPTPLLDFTTEPKIAAFFATHRRNDEPEGCIFMIDSVEFEKVFPHEEASQSLTARFLRVDVQHLWRLQAQRGAFLEANFLLDSIYPLDRIIFPHRLTPFSFPEERIYPKLSSHLESSVFEFLKKQELDKNFQQLLRTTTAAHLEVTIDENEEREKTAHLSEWLEDRAWLQVPDERWDEVVTLIDSKAPLVSPDQLTQDILQPLIEKGRSAISLVSLGDDQFEAQKIVDRIWHGMRLLPYSAKHIANAIVSSLAIRSRLLQANSANWHVILAAMEPIIPNPIEIEMEIANGTGTRALVRTEALKSAIRPEVLKEAVRTVGEGSSQQVLWVLSERYASPRRTFARDALVDLFAHEVIPWQIASYRPFIAFSPYHIRKLGLP